MNSSDYSNQILLISRNINIYATLIVILIGFIGHLLTICVFGQRRFRIKTASVYLFCLAINDSLFLFIHLFEDTLRTFKDIYFDDNENSSIKIITVLNIIDNYRIACKLVNYLRYSLRFISAYIIVAFSIQRLCIIYSSHKFKTKKSAWLTVLITILCSLISSLWVPFLFELKKLTNYNSTTTASSTYCDVNKEMKTIYFTISVVYVVLIILIPNIIIFISNALIIYKTSKIDYNNNNNSSNNSNNNNNKITKTLITISFSYAFLSTPYLIAWSLFFYQEAFRKEKNATQSNLRFAFLQICEIFFILNYSINFYIYCASDSSFLNHLKDTNKAVKNNRFIMFKRKRNESLCRRRSINK